MRRASSPPRCDPAPPPIEAPEPPLFPDWSREERLRRTGARCPAGVDEAGRGPLAGPVIAAAVVLPAGAELEGLRDSKQLAASARLVLYEAIIRQATCWAVGAAEPEEIDRINILRATHAAMARALAGLSPEADVALVDGLPAAGLPCPHEAVVDGDARCMSIAAASVIAKVTRDRIMQELDKLHPGYGFARHKGYFTPEHLQALRERGPCACHRRSFRPVLAPFDPYAASLFPEED